eukprot:2492963-Amphidinium_carterae.2
MLVSNGFSYCYAQYMNLPLQRHWFAVVCLGLTSNFTHESASNPQLPQGEERQTCPRSSVCGRDQEFAVLFSRLDLRTSDCAGWHESVHGSLPAVLESATERQRGTCRLRLWLDPFPGLLSVDHLKVSIL